MDHFGQAAGALIHRWAAASRGVCWDFLGFLLSLGFGLFPLTF